MIGLPTRVTSRISSGARPALRRRLAEQIPHRGPHRGGHLPLPARVHHHVRDPAHEVLAEADLRVHGARRRNHLARSEVADMRRDRRRADVDGRPVHPVLQARPHRDDVAVAVDRRGDAPVAGTQRRLERLQHFEVAAQVLEAPLLAERRLDPAQIPGRVVHVRLRDLHESQPNHRVDADRVHLGALAHHLPVHLAVGGNIDDDVALGASSSSPGGAPEPAAPASRGSAARSVRTRSGAPALELTPCLANSPTLWTTWHRPQIPRPPHTESRSTPSARAASRIEVPRGNRPRRPDGVKTMRASSGASPAARGVFSHDGGGDRRSAGRAPLRCRGGPPAPGTSRSTAGSPGRSPS